MKAHSPAVGPGDYSQMLPCHWNLVGFSDEQVNSVMPTAPTYPPFLPTAGCAASVFASLRGLAGARGRSETQGPKDRQATDFLPQSAIPRSDLAPCPLELGS